MRVAELIMLIVGAILFTVSFFMPDKGKMAELDEEEEKRQIKKLLEDSVSEAKSKVEEVVDDSISDRCDTAERSLDRMTNEKIYAINEYSDTVLEQIKKNHDEVMFLYDMLNNKHAQVKNTATELNQLTRAAKEASKESAPNQKGFGYVTPNPERHGDNKGFGYTDAPKQDKETVTSVDTSSKALLDAKPEPAIQKQLEQIEFEKVEVKDSSAVTKKKPVKNKTTKTPVADSNIDLMFASDSNSANNNDKILKLHKEGKSNMAIAKELGLGVGEVKLVIDLFEGI